MARKKKKTPKSSRQQRAPKKLIGGPFTTMAFICEQAIEGKDGVMSFVRVIDKMTLNLDSSAATSAGAADRVQGSNWLQVGRRAGQAQHCDLWGCHLAVVKNNSGSYPFSFGATRVVRWQ